MTLKVFDSWAGRVLVMLSIGGAIYACVHFVVKAELSDLNSKMDIANTSISQLKDGIVRIDGDIRKTNERIDSTLSDALDKLVGAKKASANQRELLEKGQIIISLATSIDARLRPASLSQYGKTLSTLTESPVVSPAAWRNLTQAVDYRTFLNGQYAPKPSDFSDFTSATGREDYRPTINLFPDRGPHPGTLAVAVGLAGGHVPEEQSARLEDLSDPRSHGSGFGFFIIDGGDEAIVLDGMYMKNVIVRNARIIYNGAPVKLENVYFVNCKFQFPLLGKVPSLQTPERKLSDAILEATAVNFTTVSPA